MSKVKYFYTVAVCKFKAFGTIAEHIKPIKFRNSADPNFDVYAVFKFDEEMLKEMMQSDSIHIIHSKEWIDTPSIEQKATPRKIIPRNKFKEDDDLRIDIKRVSDELLFIKLPSSKPKPFRRQQNK